ncbi:MAG: D-glycero-beta-D-manno-heptose 1-phosphate adenylyltransferase [Calditrichota bacterium]
MRQISDKILSRKKIAELRKELAGDGKKVVFTNGCFDILHRGHIEYLQSAAALGDVLVIGLNDDASVRRLKSADRPIVQEEDRAFLLAALEMVDYVTLFSEDTPIDLINTLLPDVLVKGGDYTRATIVGADSVEAAGGEVAVIPFTPGRSTTGVIERIKQTLK